MSFVTEQYATPALIKFAEVLKLPSVIAGVTLIALANGAGDVITSISSGGDDGDVGLVLSTIYGSGIFSQCLIYGFTIFSSTTQIVLESSDVLRDYGMLIFCNLFVIGIGIFYKKITIPIAITFIGLYVLYILIVFV